MPELSGAKILVTGPTGQVALPLTLGLAAGGSDVWGVARFHDAAARERLEAGGVTCVVADLATTDFTDLPQDFDYVLNLAVAKGGDDDWDRDLAANGESIALLIAHTRPARVPALLVDRGLPAPGSGARARRDRSAR